MARAAGPCTASWPIPALLHRDLKCGRVLANPSEILVSRGGVDHQRNHEGDRKYAIRSSMTPPRWAATYKNTAPLPGVFSLSTSFASNMRRKCADAIARQVDDGHVRHVEHSGIATHGRVFGDLRTVVQWHIPTAEVDDFAPHCNEYREVEYEGPSHPSLRKFTEKQPSTSMPVAPLSLVPERSSAKSRHSPSVGSAIIRAAALQRSRETAVHVPERFRAVAPSAVLTGLSPSSAYRDRRIIQPRRSIATVGAARDLVS